HLTDSSRCEADECSDSRSVARVGVDLLGVEAGLKVRAPAEPRSGREVEALDDVRDPTKVAREGAEVVYSADEGRLEVVQPAELLAAARKERVARRGDTERAIEARTVGIERPVLERGLVAVPPAIVPAADRDARHELVLHARGVLPVEAAHAPPVEDRRIGHRGHHAFAEVRIR